jgi:hypothetical protein
MPSQEIVGKLRHQVGSRTKERAVASTDTHKAQRLRLCVVLLKCEIGDVLTDRQLLYLESSCRQEVSFESQCLAMCQLFWLTASVLQEFVQTDFKPQFTVCLGA